MHKQQRKEKTAIVLAVVLGIVLVTGVVLGRYADTWKQVFNLLIAPTQQSDIDTTLRRYFRSNELLPVSENAAYTVNGTQGWFSVANALDTATFSADTVAYKLVWYVSADGTAWTEYKTESGTFAAGEYAVTKYAVEPVHIGGTAYNYVKVHGETSSFLQEDIEAVYTFDYADYSMQTTYENGVIAVDIDTNDVAGMFAFSWQSGISPDNADPTGMFKNAIIGPSALNVTLQTNTTYRFLFFVTDGALLERLNTAPSDASTVVSVTKK